MRKVILICTLSLLVAIGVPAAAGPVIGAGGDPEASDPSEKTTLTLQGRLVLAPGLESPHYRLGDHVLMPAAGLDLSQYADQEVEVRGTVWTAPSIFMMPVLYVEEVRPREPASRVRPPEPGPLVPLPQPVPVVPQPEPAPQPKPAPLPLPQPEPLPQPALPVVPPTHPVEVMVG